MQIVQLRRGNTMSRRQWAMQTRKISALEDLDHREVGAIYLIWPMWEISASTCKIFALQG